MLGQFALATFAVGARGARQDELVDAIGIAAGDVDRDDPAGVMPHQMEPVEAQRVGEHDDRVGTPADVHRLRDLLGVAETERVHRVHAV